MFWCFNVIFSFINKASSTFNFVNKDSTVVFLIIIQTSRIKLSLILFYFG